MKNVIAQLQLLAAKIDRRSIQFGYFALAMIAATILRSPVDGGGGPF